MENIFWLINFINYSIFIIEIIIFLNVKLRIYQYYLFRLLFDVITFIPNIVVLGYYGMYISWISDSKKFKCVWIILMILGIYRICYFTFIFVTSFKYGYYENDIANICDSNPL